jgi:hypothetical protein
MKRIYYIVFTFLFSCLFFSCSTSSLIAKKSDKANGPYKRIFILVNNAVRTEKFIHTLTENLKTEFATRNMATDVYIKTDLSLDTQKDIDQKIIDFNPDGILVINQTEGMVYNGGAGSNGGTFDLKLFDKTPDNLVWRATLKASGDFGISMAVNKVTSDLINRLEYDGIIPKS